MVTKSNARETLAKFATNDLAGIYDGQTRWKKSQLRHNDDDNAVKIKKKREGGGEDALIKTNKYCCQKNTRYIQICIRYEE